MRILFVYASLSQLGGIETLIGRLCPRLRALGHHVTVLLQESSLDRVQDPALLEQVRRHAEVRFVRGWFRSTPKSLNGLDPGGYDAIYAFESNSLLLSLAIQSQKAPNARVAMGVYHPREYCGWSKNKRFQQRLVEAVLREIPVQNVFFMNEDAAAEHSDCLQRDFTSSPVVPIAINLDQFASVNRMPDRRRIVSTGRVTNFKTYNFWMLDIMRQLNADGRRFEYHIYGSGEQSAEVAELIAQKNLTDTVFLHGDLPYARFGDVLADAFVFVGMGTAVLEAAACGVPSLVAIESCRDPSTYGFLHEVNGHNAGEYSPTAARYSVRDKIEALAVTDDDQYESLCQASRQAAARFSIERVVDAFVAALERTAPYGRRITTGMRLLDECDRWLWRTLRLAGVEDPYTHRYIRPA